MEDIGGNRNDRLSGGGYLNIVTTTTTAATVAIHWLYF